MAVEDFQRELSNDYLCSEVTTFTMSKSILYSLLFCYVFSLHVDAQDVVFTQFNSVNLFYNPSLTGSFPGNYKISAIYRNQWIGLQDQPLTQFIVSGEIKFHLGYESSYKDFIGAGLYFNTDRALVFDWNTNEMGLQFAYHKILDKTKRSFIAGGFGFGLRQRSVNYDRLYFEDQYNGLDAYDRLTRELLPQNIHAAPIIQVGVQFNTNLSKFTFIQLGLSGKHLFNTEYSFYNNLDNPDYIGIRQNTAFKSISFIGQMVHRYDAFNEISPRVLIQFQGPHGIILPGISYRKAFLHNNQSAVHFGLSTRMVRSNQSFSFTDIGLQTGVEWQNFLLGIQYDVGIRDASRYSSTSHSFEISLRLMGAYDNEFQFAPKF